MKKRKQKRFNKCRTLFLFELVDERIESSVFEFNEVPFLRTDGGHWNQAIYYHDFKGPFFVNVKWLHSRRLPNYADSLEQQSNGVS